MSDDLRFTLTDEFLELQKLREAALASANPTAWDKVTDACDAALVRFPDEPLLEVWWSEAASKVRGFPGAAEGIGRISAMCCRWDPTDYDLYGWIIEKLRQVILSVPLIDYEKYTYTAVMNGRLDPERALAVAEAVSRNRQSAEEHSEGLEALAIALKQFETAVHNHTVEYPSFDDLRPLPGRIAAYLSNPAAYRPNPTEGVYRSNAAAMGLATGEEAKAGEPAVPIPERREATEVFVQIEGFTGGSTAAQHGGWIAARSYRQTMQPPTPTIVIEKDLDAASPKLYQACATARVFPRIIFDLCRAPDDAVRVLRVELEDAQITSITQETTSETSLPMVAVTFTYGAVRWTYTQFDDRMLPEGVVAAFSRTASVE